MSLTAVRRAVDASTLELIVLPTEKCNFRCTYCYEDFVQGAMPPHVKQGLMRLIERRADEVDALALSWFGGEPLLALETVLDVTAFARETFATKGKTFQSGITTNGYRLNQNVFERLLQAGVRAFQISLDGPREVHDRSRVRAGGGPTFDQIWQNLCTIASFGEERHEAFHVTLRIHYDANTAYLLEPLVDEIAATFSPERFSINLHEIERLGGPNDDEVAEPGPREHEHVRQLMKRLSPGDDPAVRALVAVDVDDYVCYAAKANSFVVRSDGRLSKCTVALNDERNVIGRLRPDGTLQVKEDRLRPWIRGLFTGDMADLHCPLAGLPELPRERGRISLPVVGVTRT